MGINTPNRDEPSDNVGDLENLQQVIETNSQENNSETSEESSSSGSSESEKIVVKTNGKNGYLMRTESQIELEYIEANNPSGSQEDGIGEERLRSDLELLSRPSWCDAGFALSSVQKGKATGNKHILAFRAKLHRVLFRLGCFIQRNDVAVLIVGVLFLGSCGVGLINVHLETNVENLWVESGGQLAEELQYTKDTFAGTGLDSSGSGYSFQMLIQTGDETLSKESLSLHLKTAIAATEVTVEGFGREWKFEDVCYKQEINLEEGANPLAKVVAEIIERILPCLVIGPLDCFWEGSKLLGPEPPIRVTFGDLTWKNFNPRDVLQEFLNDPFARFLAGSELEFYSSLITQAGADDGFVKRWCLDPYDPECPSTAPNYQSKELPDYSAIVNAGCTGFATELMQWPLNLIVGGIKRDAAGNVTGAEGLQTLFSMLNAEGLYRSHKDKFVNSSWSVEEADKVIAAWQRKFVAEMYRLGENRTVLQNSSDDINAFTATTAGDILLEFSSIAIPRLAGGYVLMICYACVTLLRLRASKSQGAVGFVGVLLVILSVVAGLGICSAIGISFNAASTQVLPFLLLGLGVDDMFLMSHHFGEISILTYIPIEKRVGECLKRVGVSIVLTSVAILSGFLFALIIPMPALQAFVLQAAVVTVFNLISVLVIFPAILSLDLRRRKRNKLDIFCCFNSSSKNAVVNTSNENHRSSRNTQQMYDNKSYLPSEEKSNESTSSSSMSPASLQNYSADEDIKIKKSQPKKPRSPKGRSSRLYYYFGISLSEFGERYYAPFLLKNPVRIFVLILFAVLLGGSIYSATKVEDGLDLGDVLPRGTKEHAAIVAQTTYFAFFDMYIATTAFDYPNNQIPMTELHDKMGELSYVLRNSNGELPKYWLQYFRDWLRAVQEEVDQAWQEEAKQAWQAGNVSGVGRWNKQTSDLAVLGYKMLVQTGNPDDPIDTSRVGCSNPALANCDRPDRVRLVSDDGIIRQDSFYNLLTAWASNDILSYAAALAQIQPEPPSWTYSREDSDWNIPRSPDITYAQMSFYLNDMRENADFVFVINWVRNRIKETQESSAVRAYPRGYPFTFWQQYITLRFWLFISLGCVIVAVFLVLSLILLNPWAAAIMALFLAMIATELLGFMGITGVKLSAVPAVILVAAIGLGVEFTVHITFAYITSCGSRRDRVIRSIGHMIEPVVDGAISTFLGVIMLAWAEFDFIVTYFFQVLAVLILLGVLNGLVLLPVMLSFIGPPPEVIPAGGKSRLDTPTPTSTPTSEKKSFSTQLST